MPENNFIKTISNRNISPVDQGIASGFVDTTIALDESRRERKSKVAIENIKAENELEKIREGRISIMSQATADLVNSFMSRYGVGETLYEAGQEVDTELFGDATSVVKVLAANEARDAATKQRNDALIRTLGYKNKLVGVKDVGEAIGILQKSIALTQKDVNEKTSKSHNRYAPGTDTYKNYAKAQFRLDELNEMLDQFHTIATWTPEQIKANPGIFDRLINLIMGEKTENPNTGQKFNFDDPLPGE